MLDVAGNSLSLWTKITGAGHKSPARSLWASAYLSEKLTVQNALFPEGICYRTDIGFFEPPTEYLQALVFKMLLSSVGEMCGEEIKNGRGEWI